MLLADPIGFNLRAFSPSAWGLRLGRCLASLGVVAVFATVGRGQELRVESPQPWQVIQRSDAGGSGESGHGSRGSARVRVMLVGVDSAAQPVTWEARVRAASAEGARLSPEPWRDLTLAGVRESPAQPGTVVADVVVPAGGWYRLEVRERGRDGTIRREAAVEPFGVGEVFLVAGQSYATNTNDERLSVTDARQRVAAYDVATRTWRLADDPQPAGDRSEHGSIWPPVGDALARALDVPIGFANVAVGGTSSAQWMPEGPLSARLQQAGRDLGRFRAVLWQQGESDVLADTPTAEYVSRLERIRASAVEAWGFAPPWICALSTHHPTVYRKPDAEERIRIAIMEVCRRPSFVLGPDTDQLQGENRGGPQSRRHFSALGQRNAARLWSEVLLLQLPATR